MNFEMVLLKGMRKINPFKMNESRIDLTRAEIYDQDANDYIRYAIESCRDGLMIAKFGTVELANIVCYLKKKEGAKVSDKILYMRGGCGSIFPEDNIKILMNNAGFFPNDLKLWERYCELVLDDAKYIDILGSYITDEIYIDSFLCNCKKKVNLDGYLAPYKWDKPWSMALKGKRVLVVHPFAESIYGQYEKRKFLFEDNNVLPDFLSFNCIKAVQSIANNGKNTEFSDWFEALEYMKDEIDKVEYDIAIIGCGAYGMNIAAHCKRKGKIAIHMASWVQMLFGVYGQRWLTDNIEYKQYINEYWVRPKKTETPQGARNVENGAYW